VGPGGAPWDVAIAGGGIVGLATARALGPRVRVVVLEAETRLAAHQSGRNSGVLHSGLYYAPGSFKARLCVAGRAAMLRFCEAHAIPYAVRGKLVVATVPAEVPRLEALAERGRTNGLAGLRRLAADEIRAHEPNVAGVAALWVPETGVVDFARVAAALADEVRAAGGEVALGARVVGCRRERGGLVLETTAGAVHAAHVVACAGLHADRVARLCGIAPGLAIVPFRGEFWRVRRALVRGLVYPVPDPAFPFLGVHFTRRIDGTLEAGPNAVLALAREGYRRTSVSPRDVAALAADAGTRRLVARHWRMGLGELWRSFSKRASVAALRRLVPSLDAADLAPGGAGVRAQAVLADGTLVDDFRIVEAERMIHVLNAPSPAATASLAIGETIATMAARRLALPAASRPGGDPR
jgi:L-2-hydroxyglutarate oxidase LhgO